MSNEPSPKPTSAPRKHIWWFLAAASVACWILGLTDWLHEDSTIWRRVAWASGWLAFAGLLCPYLHVLRVVLFGHRQYRWLGGQTLWLRIHLIGSFIAFFFLLLHSGGRSTGWLTAFILVFFWLVMLSGIVGFWGRRLIYRFLNVAIRPEFGRERLRTKERDRLERRANRLFKCSWSLTDEDIEQANWKAFCEKLTTPIDALNKQGTKGAAKSTVWLRADNTRMFKEADRICRRAVAGENLALGELNPVIGVLNELLESTNGVTIEELEQIAIDKGAQQVFDKARKEMDRTRDEKEKNRIRTRIFLEILCSELAERQPPTNKLRDFYEKHIQKLLDNRVEQRMRCKERSKKLFKQSMQCKERSKELFEQSMQCKERSKELFEQSMQRKARSKKLFKQRIRFEEKSKELLEKGFPSWRWIFQSEASEPISAAVVESYRLLLDDSQKKLLNQLLKWVERRRRLNVEEWFDRLAYRWLWIHGFLAALLGALVIDHVVGSVYFAW